MTWKIAEINGYFKFLPRKKDSKEAVVNQRITRMLNALQTLGLQVRGPLTRAILPEDGSKRASDQGV